MKNVLITSIGCAPASAIARTIRGNPKYKIFGVDIQTECVGNFITDIYIQCPRITSPDYWPFIQNIIHDHNIEFVFVTNNIETLPWAKMKSMLNCKVFLNEHSIVEIMDDKQKTIDWCKQHNVLVPEDVTLETIPCVVKSKTGAGSCGVRIVKDNSDICDSSDAIVQRYIEGQEYTIDILSDQTGRVVNIVPKKRILVKHGQSFKSIVSMEEDIIEFARNICETIGSKYVINIQIIKEKDTGKLYLIEMNPRWATTIGLSIHAGANFPIMLLEDDCTPKEVNDRLMMVRDYHEYFMKV